MVRDQVGQRVKGSSDAEVVLFKEGEEISRSSITNLSIAENYELAIRLDAARAGTTLYREKAYAVNSSYSLAVDINGIRYYPIEVSGDLRVGLGGERHRLDLNLGSDLDGDGLPDVWEEWQLYQAGERPDESGNWDLSLIGPDGDFDGDGQKDGFEYIAGTFAGDASETFGLDIKAWREGEAHFEFYQITGKAYTLEASPDGESWEQVAFAVEASPERASYQADAVGVVTATSPAENPQTLFRLTVR
ncbi:MAG: hypothetical protein Q7Q71_03430 [Verrucomicrobiota bacterium JB023]|nr:hypothetical protein [Verrucomicrobiota bacterium JB023]